MLSRPGRARRRRLLPYVPAVVEERGAWRTFSERTIYDNRRVRLGLVDVESPDGRRWDYHVVHLARIAVELIVNESTDEVLMLWRYRFATDQWGYELLGGLADEGEESAATAAREAANEPGWAPLGPAEKLINFESLPGNVTAPMDVSLWRTFERRRADRRGGGRADRVGALLASDRAIQTLLEIAIVRPRPSFRPDETCRSPAQLPREPRWPRRSPSLTPRPLLRSAAKRG
jgi:ADP-ribose pyrophosphatase